MKVRKLSTLMVIILIVGFFPIVSNSNEQLENTNNIGVNYSTHIQDYGWEKDFSKKDGDVSGTEENLKD